MSLVLRWYLAFLGTRRRNWKHLSREMADGRPELRVYDVNNVEIDSHIVTFWNSQFLLHDVHPRYYLPCIMYSAVMG